MSIDLQTPLSTLAELVRAADPDAAGRRPWLARVQQILAGRADAGEDQRRKLSDRLERWRYDFLDEPRGPLTAEDRRAVDAMDLAANRLAGGAERPARWPRAAGGSSWPAR